MMDLQVWECLVFVLYFGTLGDNPVCWQSCATQKVCVQGLHQFGGVPRLNNELRTFLLALLSSWYCGVVFTLLTRRSADFRA